mmetsp:Transcript_76986/g.198253  ORF Transcript_76986/g.198253 Transcript_76986/m.198253 type:complete len:569 (-) Transcript_76986:348-2054(-)
MRADIGFGLRQEFLLVSHLLLKLSQGGLCGDKGLLLRPKHLARSCLVLLERLLRLRFLRTGRLHLLSEILGDHLQGGRDARVERLLATVVTALPRRLRRLVLVDGVLPIGLLLQERLRGLLVVLVELVEGHNRSLEKLDGGIVVLQGLLELGVLLVPHLRHLPQLRLGVLDVVLELVSLGLQLVLHALHALDILLRLGLGVVKVLELVLVFLGGPLAAITMRDILLLLLAQRPDHVVDHGDYLVEVAAGLCRHSDAAEARAAEARSQRPQLLVRAGAAALAGASRSRELQQRRAGVGEDSLRLRARQDLLGLGNAHELLRAQPGAHGPLLGLDPAALLRVLEEDLVRLQLRLGVIAQRRSLRQLLCLVCLVALVPFKCLLQRGQLILLRRHELLVRLLLPSLLAVALLDITGECVVHAFQDALDLRRLRRVVPKRVVAHLCRAEAAVRMPRGAGKVRRARQEVSQRLHIVLLRIADRSVLGEHLADAGGNAQQLRVLHGGQEGALLASTRAAEHGDCGLEGADALLGLGLLLLVGGVLLVAHLGGFLLRLQVLRNVLLELFDLGAMRG